MKPKKATLWERYLTKEIGIEFKACLYFFGILFYYSMFQVLNGVYTAEILYMAEMIFLTYIMGYLQVFVLWNFDEADRLGKKEVFAMILCTLLYTAISYIGNWFGANLYVTAGFGAYMLFMYICVFLVYKIRREIDDKMLNADLDLFKTRNRE